MEPSRNHRGSVISRNGPVSLSHQIEASVTRARKDKEKEKDREVSRSKRSAPKKLKLSSKGLKKKIEHMAQQQYELNQQLVEDRQHRRQMREIRRDDGEEDVSEDSEDEEIDRYMGLTDEEKWARMLNEAKESIMAEEVRRLMVKEKKRQNALQNKARRQGQNALFEAEKVRGDIERKLEKQDVYHKKLVILEPLSCVTTTLEMCLIGYKETMRHLNRNDIYQQYEKATTEQCKISVELVFLERLSPIQVKVEMLWRFAVIMHAFMHGSRSTQREKYLSLAAHAYSLLRDQVRLERERRAHVREYGTDEEVALLAGEADWEVGHPALHYELSALLNSAEMEMDEEDAIALHLDMEIANNAHAFTVLREKVVPVAMPERVTAPE